MRKGKIIHAMDADIDSEHGNSNNLSDLRSFDNQHDQQQAVMNFAQSINPTSIPAQPFPGDSQAYTQNQSNVSTPK